MKEKLTSQELFECVGGLQLIVGLNHFEDGAHTVSAPPAAIQGATNALFQVITKGPGELSNIEVIL